MTGQRKRLSMLRSYTPADAFTLANASCGTISIFLCLSYIADERSGQLWAAFVLPVIALACDVADGYIARLDTARQSLLGADLDSLADIVSFGVAPAVLGYTLGLRGLWDVVCLTWFVCCGISRLARFNVTSASLTNEAPAALIERLCPRRRRHPETVLVLVVARQRSGVPTGTTATGQVACWSTCRETDPNFSCWIRDPW